MVVINISLYVAISSFFFQEWEGGRTQIPEEPLFEGKGDLILVAVTARQISLFKGEEFILVTRENVECTRSVSYSTKYYCTLSWGTCPDRIFSKKKKKKEGEHHVPDTFLNILANQGRVNSSGFKTTSLTGSGIYILWTHNERFRS